jgi:hypothetical protein
MVPLGVQVGTFEFGIRRGVPVGAVHNSGVLRRKKIYSNRVNFLPYMACFDSSHDFESACS